jgi:hypothetical protein
MSESASKSLVTVVTKGTDPLTGTSTKPRRTANRRRTRQEAKAGGGQLPSLVTSASEPGYQPTLEEQADTRRSLRAGKLPQPRIKVGLLAARFRFVML